jgi:hypothetical protein
MKPSIAGMPARGARIRAALQTCAVALAFLGMGNAGAGESGTGFATALRATYSAVRDQLSHNPFQRPIILESGQTSDSVTGDIHALVNSPFATISAGLTSADSWCDVMMLHLNTKYCRASTVNQRDVLHVSIGKKHNQPLRDAHPVTFAYRVITRTPAYLRIQLNADEGPLSTRDYRIVLEAIPMGSGQTFLRLSYSYRYGMVGRLAMQTYLGTIGSNKVGFTVTGKQPNGESLYIGGMRGLVERNTMRYYLAVEAYLGALAVPPQARLEKSLQDWFAAIERYPRQLHELEKNEYLGMKRKEFLRQQTEPPPGVQG